MKFSSWLALGALVGRECAGGKRTWIDAALAAILAKNEMLDKEGIIRKLIDKGATDRELKEIQGLLDKELAKRESKKNGAFSGTFNNLKKRRGFWGGFARGLSGED